MYLRLLSNDRFCFLDERINSIIDSDIRISIDEYRDFFTRKGHFRIRKDINPEEGLFGYIEEYEVKPVVKPTIQEKINASLIKQNAKLLLEIQMQKDIINRLFLEIQNIKESIK